ncbi:MAG: ribosomal protein S18-alanine N-acetyltransferase [Clostridia bacterium]|nr:ribosomal protein S18-alanine N-acetyltransferase [Clostridia bacterium]
MSDGRIVGRVRSAVIADVDKIAELEKRSFSDPWTDSMISSCFNDSMDVFVLEWEGKVCGFAVFDRTLGDEAEIHNIAIDPELRGKGLSGSLMDAILASAEKHGINRIMLEVRISNAPAIGLYTKYGFKKVGLRAGYYRNPTEDALLMDLLTDKRATDSGK